MERFAGAADAVTAAELAALFADLPAPHPTLPGPDASQVSIEGGHAAVSGPLGFATCLHAAGYPDAAIERASLRPGDTMCVRTNGHRLALVTIVDASEQSVEFGATVWDPPVPS